MASKKKRGKERQNRKERQGWVSALTGRFPSFACKGGGRIARYSDTGCGYCHGCTFVPPPDHELSTFMNEFHKRIYSLTSNGILLLTAECGAVWKAMPPDLQTEPDLRLKATSLLLRLGINLTLARFHAMGSSLRGQSQENQQVITNIVHRLLAISLFLVALEPQYQDDPNNNDFVALIVRSAAPRVMKLMHGNIRDFIKYLHKKAKKVSCTCLRPFYLMSREVMPKVGRCIGCQREMDRKDLMVCQCGYTFCSRECQKMLWPQHKSECKQIGALRNGTIALKS